MKPLNEYVVIKREDSEKQTAGGIILPESAQKTNQIGFVVAVGEGKVLSNGDRNPPSVSVGDKVVFAPYTATEITVNNEKFTIISEEYIYSILD